MFKKITYLFVFLLVGVIISFQSCTDSEAPIQAPINEIGLAGNGCDTTANVFCGTLPNVSFQNPCAGDVNTIDLWVGVGNVNAGTLVGHVQFLQSGTGWIVKYTFTSPNFNAEEIHFAISDTRNGIPQSKKGNPIPGQFAYKFDLPPNTTSFEFPITLPPDPAGDGWYIAAHAAGGAGTIGFNLLLPLPEVCSVLSNVIHNYPVSYLKATLTNAGGFNGTYDTWCIDNASSHGDYNCVNLYSVFEPLPPELTGFPLIDKPQNLVLVNYLINHFQAGVTTVIPTSDTVNCTPTGAAEVVTVDDIQAAIWTLVDEGPGALNFDQERVNGIICVVKSHRNYDPCLVNEDMAFIVAAMPVGGVFPVQPVLVKIPCGGLPGGGTGTAWGDGKYGGNFPGSNWATFFRWKTTCP